MITFEGVTRRHRQHAVVDDVSFTARAGAVTGFVGPNGAGKSTCLRILLGLERPDDGHATIDGRPYARLRRPLCQVGASLGGAGAHPSRRAVDHLAWVAASQGLPRRRVGEVLEEVGLSGHGRQRVGRFSLGMAQRLGIAVTLLGDPPVLVLDEPINGLDPEGIRWVRDLALGRAAEGGTVLLSSHVMSELEPVADDLVVLAAGRVRAAGPFDQVVAGHESREDAFFALTGAGAR